MSAPASRSRQLRQARVERTLRNLFPHLRPGHARNIAQRHWKDARKAIEFAKKAMAALVVLMLCGCYSTPYAGSGYNNQSLGQYITAPPMPPYTGVNALGPLGDYHAPTHQHSNSIGMGRIGGY